MLHYYFTDESSIINGWREFILTTYQAMTAGTLESIHFLSSEILQRPEYTQLINKTTHKELLKNILDENVGLSDFLCRGAAMIIETGLPLAIITLEACVFLAIRYTRSKGAGAIKVKEDIGLGGGAVAAIIERGVAVADAMAMEGGEGATDVVIDGRKIEMERRGEMAGGKDFFADKAAKGSDDFGGETLFEIGGVDLIDGTDLVKEMAAKGLDDACIEDEDEAAGVVLEFFDAMSAVAFRDGRDEASPGAKRRGIPEKTEHVLRVGINPMMTEELGKDGIGERLLGKEEPERVCRLII